MNNWIDVKEEKPPKGEVVLIKIRDDINDPKKSTFYIDDLIGISKPAIIENANLFLSL